MQSSQVISFEGVFFLLKDSQLLLYANPAELSYLYPNFLGSVNFTICEFSSISISGSVYSIKTMYPTIILFLTYLKQIFCVSYRLCHVYTIFLVSFKLFREPVSFFFFGKLSNSWYIVGS